MMPFMSHIFHLNMVLAILNVKIKHQDVPQNSWSRHISGHLVYSVHYVGDQENTLSINILQPSGAVLCLVALPAASCACYQQHRVTWRHRWLHDGNVKKRTMGESSNLPFIILWLLCIKDVSWTNSVLIWYVDFCGDMYVWKWDILSSSHGSCPSCEAFSADLDGCRGRW